MRKLDWTKDVHITPESTLCPEIIFNSLIAYLINALSSSLASHHISFHPLSKSMLYLSFQDYVLIVMVWYTEILNYSKGIEL